MSTPFEDFLLDDAGGGSQSYLNADMRTGATVGGKESLSIDRAALQLTGYNEQTLAPLPGWGGLGQPYTLTYAFRSAATTMPSDIGGFERFNAQQIYQAEQSLQSWADVANIHFTRVGAGTSGEGAYSNNAIILFGNYRTGESGASAYSFFPGSASSTADAGDVWINDTYSYNAAPIAVNYGAQVLVHEIGHTIGLNHPGDYDAHGDLPFSYANDAEYYEDSRQYSVMSYFNEANTGGAYGGSYARPPSSTISAPPRSSTAPT